MMNLFTAKQEARHPERYYFRSYRIEADTELFGE